MMPLFSIFALVCIYLHIMHKMIGTQLAVFYRILFDRFNFSGKVSAEFWGFLDRSSSSESVEEIQEFISI